MSRFERGENSPDTVPTGLQPLDYHHKSEQKPSGSAMLKFAGIVGFAAVLILIFQRH